MGSMNLLARYLKTWRRVLNAQSLNVLKVNPLEAALKINNLNLELFNLKLAYGGPSGKNTQEVIN